MIDLYRDIASMLLPIALWWGWLAWSRWNVWVKLATDSSIELSRIKGDASYQAILAARQRIRDEAIEGGKVAVVIVRPWPAQLREESKP